MVNNELFRLKEIPKFIPGSMDHFSWWKAEKRKCIEGVWIGGRWMPGPVYFYINFWKIRLHNKRGSKVKVLGRPHLRDLEWEKGYVYMEAKGFSGFEKDKFTTCHRKVQEAEKDPNFLPTIDIPKSLYPNLYKENGNLKKYTPAREYLRKNHKNYGKALFENEAKNVLDIEARGTGKSFFAAGPLISHNFLFDGMADYDEYLLLKKDGDVPGSEILIGAIDTKYSKPLIAKVKLGLNNLEGAQKYKGRKIPSPLSRQYSGTWKSGDAIEALYDKKTPGGWEVAGTGSAIYHRSFKDNSEAGNGLRVNLAFLEEIGFMGNLVSSLGSLKDVTQDSELKFGVIWMSGTGGQMASGATEAAQEIFYDPDAHDCLVFEDQWEGKGDIGFFIPYNLALNGFKDPKTGETDIEASDKWIEKKREKLKKAKSKEPWNKEQQNNPIKPSEAFLMSEGNVFPIGDLKDHLNWLEASVDGYTVGDCGELVFGKDNLLKWENDFENKLRPTDYPVRKGEHEIGCIQIWEHPKYFNGEIPYGLYIAGTDPYDHDRAENTTSLGSTFIYKTLYMEGKGVYEWPVAEYTGRPARADEHHETVRRLLLYYNAKDLYENQLKTIQMHFSHKHSLYLLCNTPTILKSTENSNVDRQYGLHMTKNIKDELEIYTRDWLLTPCGDDKLNLHKIFSKPLLKELIAYNAKGNFDRVIAFMLTIAHRLQNHKTKVEIKKKIINVDPFIARAGTFFTNKRNGIHEYI